MALRAELATSSAIQRRETAAVLVESMRAGTTNAANLAYHGLCAEVIRGLHATESPAKKRAGGELSTVGSAALLRSVPRVSGFLKAIGRADPANAIIDVGTGSSAILAVSAAVLHPKSEVHTYEINPRAAACAQEVIRLFGLDKRITVHSKDALQENFPEVDLAITETFGAALMGEDGPKITAQLGKVAAHMLPAKVVLHGTDSISQHRTWSPAAIVDLRADNTIVEGSFPSTAWSPDKPTDVSVYASYYDDLDRGVITNFRADTLTSEVLLGEIQPPPLGTPINFRYETCSPEADSYREVWVQS